MKQGSWRDFRCGAAAFPRVRGRGGLIRSGAFSGLGFFIGNGAMVHWVTDIAVIMLGVLCTFGGAALCLFGVFLIGLMK